MCSYWWPPSVERVAVTFWGWGRGMSSMSEWWKKFGPAIVKHKRKCPREGWKDSLGAEEAHWCFPIQICHLRGAIHMALLTFTSHTWQSRCKSHANGQWDRLQPGSWQDQYCWKSRGEKRKFPHGPCWAATHVLSFNPHNSSAGEIFWSLFFPGRNETQRSNWLGQSHTALRKRAKLGFTSKGAWLPNLCSSYWDINLVLIACQTLCCALFHSTLPLVQSSK